MTSPNASKSLRFLFAGVAAAALAGCGTLFGDRSSSSSTGSTGQQSGAMAAPAVSEDLVRTVQERLRARDVNAGPVDGIWGPETQQGLRRFQQSQGLQATGQLNAETLQALGITGQRGEGAAAPRASTPATGTTGTAAQGASPSGAGAQNSATGAPSFRNLDANNDGEVSLAEAAADTRISRNFERADQDRNGRLSMQEFQRAVELGNASGQGSRGTQ